MRPFPERGVGRKAPHRFAIRLRFGLNRPPDQKRQAWIPASSSRVSRLRDDGQGVPCRQAFGRAGQLGAHFEVRFRSARSASLSAKSDPQPWVGSSPISRTLQERTWRLGMVEHSKRGGSLETAGRVQRPKRFECDLPGAASARVLAIAGLTATRSSDRRGGEGLLAAAICSCAQAAR